MRFLLEFWLLHRCKGLPRRYNWKSVLYGVSRALQTWPGLCCCPGALCRPERLSHNLVTVGKWRCPILSVWSTVSLPSTCSSFLHPLQPALCLTSRCSLRPGHFPSCWLRCPYCVLLNNICCIWVQGCWLWCDRLVMGTAFHQTRNSLRVGWCLPSHACIPGVWCCPGHRASA